MGKLLYRQNEYIVVEEENERGVVLINTAGSYKNHGHIRRAETAIMMIRLLERHIIPKSDYLRVTALRVSLNEEYKQAIAEKIKRSKQKRYYNVNKGVMR